MSDNTRGVGRPRKYDPESTSTIRFYIDEDAKAEIQIYAIRNRTTLQEIYSKYTKDLLAKIREESDRDE